jgi:hypothetical protein
MSHRLRPPGLIVTPPGSGQRLRATALRARDIHGRHLAPSSFGLIVEPSADTSKDSGSSPLLSIRHPAVGVDYADAVGGAVCGRRFDASTPGPAIGEPDRGEQLVPSGVAECPRPPTAIRPTTVPATGSITTTAPPVSSDT